MGGLIYDLRYSDEQEKKYQIISRSVKTSNSDYVLDIGCGTGLFMHKLNGVIVGIDISIELLNQSIVRLNGSINLLNADAENLPFRCCIFNKVFGITLFQNIPDPLKALSELKRISSRDGDICVSIIKKALKLSEFKKLISAANLKSLKILDSTSADWIITGKKP